MDQFANETKSQTKMKINILQIFFENEPILIEEKDLELEYLNFSFFIFTGFQKPFKTLF